MKFFVVCLPSRKTKIKNLVVILLTVGGTLKLNFQFCFLHEKDVEIIRLADWSN